MQIPLRTPVAKILGLVSCLTATAVYLALVSSQYLAFHFAEKDDLKSLQWAVRLEPGNAEYQYRLAQALALAQHMPETAEALENAVKTNPHRAGYWMGLAYADNMQGYAQGSLAALQHALAVDPKNPKIAFAAGNLYLHGADIHSAFQLFRIALEGEPSLSAQIIAICWQARPDADALLTDVIPANPGAYSSFLEFLISKKETESAAKVWTRIVGLGQPAKLSDVFDYIRYLIGHHQPAQARIVWQQAGPLCDLRNYQPSQDNLVVNGDFSLNVLNGGFDWFYEKRSDVALELDATQPHLGPRSLSISYDSQGLDDSGIHQVIPVAPNTSYHFSAYFKTQNLEGAGGPQFFLQDFYSEKTYFQSDDLRDSDVWKPVGGDFATGPDAGLLALQVKRVPAGRAIRGKLWIDGIRLKPYHQNVQ